MDDTRRCEGYYRQTGNYRLTYRQWRRRTHKRNHAAAPFGPKASA